jgi:hypothetical protein
MLRVPISVLGRLDPHGQFALKMASNGTILVDALGSADIRAECSLGS